MADLWQQFHGLPKAIRDGVATPKAIAAVDELEQQHPGVELASFVMRVAVREIPVADLAAKISAESSVTSTDAKNIAERLHRDVFTGVVADYLGLPSVPTPTATPPLSTSAVPPRPPVNLPVGMATSTPAKPPAAPKPKSSVPSTPLPVAPVMVPLTPLPKVPVSTMPGPQAPVGVSAPTTQYSDEDAAEIANQASKLRALTSVNPNQDLDSLARQILIEQNLASSDELLERRSISIIKSRLKGLRTTEETAETLTRDPKVGGLGLDHEIAMTVAAAAERHAATLKNRGMVRPPEPLPAPQPPAVPSVMQQRPAPMPPLRRDQQPKTAVPVQNFTEAPRASRPILRPTDMPILAPMAKPQLPKTAPPPTTPTVIQRPRMTDRPTVADVVRPQVALGPAEELRSMTLIEFRRLGQGAGDAARKLLDKFQHLQRESFAVWAQAVAGWRQSDVYQLYLTMGRESLETGQPISQIIADRGKNGQPYLSEHEFTVLSDLNRQLQL